MDKKENWMTGFIDDVVEHKVCQDQDRIEAAKQYDEKISSSADPMVKEALESKKEEILAGNVDIPTFEQPEPKEEPKAEEPEKTAETEKTEKEPEEEPKN